MSKLDNVESMLADKSGIPWVAPSSGLRRQILAATVEAGGSNQVAGKIDVRRWWGAAAAAAVIAAGWIGVYTLSSRPASVPEVAMALDPTPEVDRLVQGVSASLETSLTSEAQQFLDHADRVARNVIAQLPFTSPR
ncbi:MAG: hypothetical protein KF678_02630 [Phycisphaeraceae bacterium]|nr:hypothetical protein [Phycisphaeraceae bacterium]